MYDGKTESVPVTFKNGKATITVKHFSAYIIYKADVPTFVDVISGTYYYDAVLWAIENGITEVTSKTTFSPDDDCTRGQIVTFIYRDFVK